MRVKLPHLSNDLSNYITFDVIPDGDPHLYRIAIPGTRDQIRGSIGAIGIASVNDKKRIQIDVESVILTQ